MNSSVTKSGVACLASDLVPWMRRRALRDRNKIANGALAHRRLPTFQYLVWLTVLLAGCTAEVPPPDDKLPQLLSGYQLFDGDLSQLSLSRGVIRYSVNAPSFCDYAQTDRVLRLPSDQAIQYQPNGTLEFPVGTVLAQTFSYSTTPESANRRIIETRILLRRSDKWIGLPYVWNEAQTEATLELVGGRIPVQRVMADGSIREQTHLVPNFNDCKRCHRIGDEVTPLAITVRQLNCPQPEGGESQLTAWQSNGWLKNLPPASSLSRLATPHDAQSGSLEQRARAYLEANCAHCHNPAGAASNSGLQLAADIEQPRAYGILKTPVAAGRGSGGLTFDILPGAPESSILVHRVRSIESGVMMPEIGRSQIDAEGAALLSEWIASMPPATETLAKAGLVGIVSSLSAEEVSRWADEALSRGDPQRGRQVFERQELNCTKCHAISGKGGNVGPDLAKLDVPNLAQHIVESILLPDRTVKDDYRAVTVQTETGLVVTGVQVYDDGIEVLLRDPVRGDTRIRKAEIEATSRGGSLMPANLVAALSRESFLDLIRYLIEASGKEHSTQASAAGGG